MTSYRSSVRVGVYVDVANLAMNGGYGMRYDVLREFACRGDAEPVRLNAYVTFDPERANDYAYKSGQDGFYSRLREFGYKVIQKNFKWYVDETGKKFGKANADLDLAVDALLQSERLDRVLLATGDGDFVQVARALQNKGCRVEGVAFDNVSADLRREVDMFISGYLIPDLLPSSTSRHGGPDWGDIGSRVRGHCYSHSEKGFGFLRFMKTISPDLWKTDTRKEESPYESVFFHDSWMPEDVSTSSLPNRNMVFEFDLEQSENKESGMQAANIQLVSPKRKRAS